MFPVTTDRFHDDEQVREEESKHGGGKSSIFSDALGNLRFVNFVVKVRCIFMDQFAKHKDLFPGIDGEVSIVSTSVFSFAWNLQNL